MNMLYITHIHREADCPLTISRLVQILRSSRAIFVLLKFWICSQNLCQINFILFFYIYQYLWNCDNTHWSQLRCLTRHQKGLSPDFVFLGPVRSKKPTQSIVLCPQYLGKLFPQVSSQVKQNMLSFCYAVRSSCCHGVVKLSFCHLPCIMLSYM